MFGNSIVGLCSQFPVLGGLLSQVIGVLVQLNVITTPTGQKLTQMTPTLSSQSVQAISQFQLAVAEGIKKQMSEHSN